MNNIQEVHSIEQILDIMIKEYGYDKNPRVFLLAQGILMHMKRLDEDLTIIDSFPETYGIKKYILRRGKDGLINEMLEKTGEENTDSICEVYAMMYFNHELNYQKVKR